ncbi:hypothetical protein EZV62_005540 [Acer yangbiense]|uniref:GDSL esterase/lipase n=1 Tax=Acer yangbiense TaxID=1000413 RepID=A0A5C7IN36_9ROSI|nr:hypothetical protein EZV62_005540 [Acer yangbiense]
MFDILSSLAQIVGLPFPPPYLGLSDMENKTLRTGVNYASGGCGILSAGKNSLGSCLPFYKQIDYFEITIKNLKKRFRSKERLAHYLSKSLLFIDIGNVDMSNDYDGFGSTIYLKYTVRQYAQIVSKEFFKSLKRLYKLGARKFLVNNLGAIGCIPALEIGPIHKTLCAKKANMRAIEYNKILSKMLPKVQSSLPGSKIALGDTYKVLMDTVTFPALYGITNTKDSCCKGINGSGTLPCAPGVTPCKNRNQYAFFDSFHQSELIYFLITKRSLKESSICSPINLLKLLQA